MSWSARLVKDALCRRYPHEKGWITATEVASSRADRYADHLAIYCWPTPCVVGHEIKVSRADFFRELEDPTKRDWVEKTCQRRWFVCPKGLILPQELPETWGLMEVIGKPGDPKLRQKVAAPLIKVDDPIPTWCGRVLWKLEDARRGLAHQRGELKKKIDGEAHAERERDYQDRMKELRQREGGLLEKEEELESVWTELCRHAGIAVPWRARGFRGPRFPAKELARKMRVEAARRVLEDARHAQRRCEDLVKHAEEELERLEAES